MHSLTFVNGKKVTGLVLSGNNYISKERLDETLFTRENMKTLIDTDEATGEKTEYTDAVLIQQVEFQGEFYTCFRELSKEEKEREDTANAITELSQLVASLMS